MAHVLAWLGALLSRLLGGSHTIAIGKGNQAAKAEGDRSAAATTGGSVTQTNIDTVNVHQPPPQPVAGPIVVVDIPGGESWYAVWPGGDGVAPCTWVHCAVRLVNKGTSPGSVGLTVAELQGAGGVQHKLHIVDKDTWATYRLRENPVRQKALWSGVGGRERIERESQIVKVGTDAPVDVDIYARADAALELDYQPARVTVTCIDQPGHTSVWTGELRYIG